jgi:hypothetical protein
MSYFDDNESYLLLQSSNGAYSKAPKGPSQRKLLNEAIREYGQVYTGPRLQVESEEEYSARLVAKTEAWAKLMKLLDVCLVRA